jgi:hypothetical protein
MELSNSALPQSVAEVAAPTNTSSACCETTSHRTISVHRRRAKRISSLDLLRQAIHAFNRGFASEGPQSASMLIRGLLPLIVSISYFVNHACLTLILIFERR